MKHFTSREQVKITCSKCGGNVIRHTRTGRLSAQELGRPRGASGSDTAWYEKECQNCGFVNDCLVDKFHLCWICGQRSTRNISGYGSGDWIPGVPTEIALCADAQCETSATAEMGRLETAAVEGGLYE